MLRTIDFASWLLPCKDQNATNITQFRHFLFRKQTTEDKYIWYEEGYQPVHHEFDAKWCVISICLTRIVGCTNLLIQRINNNTARMPCCDLENRTALEPFRDLTVPSRGKDGETKSLPQDHIVKTSEEILEVEKKRHDWVVAPNHGVSDTQQQQFKALLRKMVGNANELPVDIIKEFPAWRLPLPFTLRDSIPIPVEPNQLQAEIPCTPPPRIVYG